MPVILLLFIGTNAMAQEPKTPANIVLETRDDYIASEKLVLESIEWAQNTPLTSSPAKRKEVNAFLFKWMSGSPTVTIDLVGGLIPADCSECLMSFLNGWVKYSLENDYSDNKVDCAMAGVESTIAFYEKNKSALGKQSDIEKLIKRKNKGQLRKYVEEQF